MATERDQLKSLVDQLPDNQLPLLRAAIESLLHPSPDARSTTVHKKYPERTPVGGIITPQ